MMIIIVINIMNQESIESYHIGNEGISQITNNVISKEIILLVYHNNIFNQKLLYTI